MSKVSGYVAGGVVVLALVVVAAAFVGYDRSLPGPGSVSVTAHVVAAVTVVVAQVVADRRKGVLSLLASIVVFGAAGLLLWTQWWG